MSSFAERWRWIAAACLIAAPLPAEDLGETWGTAKREREYYRIVQRAIPEGLVVEAGAATSVYAATAPELGERGGLYLEDCHVADVDDEIAQLTERHAERRLELEETRERWQAAMHDVDANSQTRESLEKKRREAREKAQSLRQQVAPARERQQQLAMERQRLETERAGLEQQTARSHDQRARLAEKLAMLEEQRATLREPEEETRELLEQTGSKHIELVNE